MKILILNWRDIKHPWAGGSEVNIHEMARLMVKGGHQVTILCANHFEKRGINRETIDGVVHLRMGTQYTVHLIAPIYYFLRLRKTHDVLIDVEHGIPFFILLLPNARGYCLVNHIHRRMFFIEMNFPANYIGYFIETRLLPLLYRRQSFIVISQTTKRDVVSLGVPEKNVNIVYAGLNHSIYKQGGTKYKTPTLIYMGRLRRYKRVSILLEVFPLVLKSVKDAKLIIVGDGIERQNLINQTEKLFLQDKVEILGYVSEEKKVELLQKSWVYVTPSSVEGWGLGILEANACGTPAIGFNVPGVKEAIVNNDSGLLVCDEDGLVNACVKILTDYRLRRHLEEGAIKRASGFDWNDSTKELLRLLDRKCV